MFLVLLKPVSRAEFKYVCIVWIGNQIREIFIAMSRKMSFGADFYADFFHTDTMCFFWSLMRVSDGKKVSK